jgi:hypothetical protein
VSDCHNISRIPASARFIIRDLRFKLQVVGYQL